MAFLFLCVGGQKMSNLLPYTSEAQQTTDETFK